MPKEEKNSRWAPLASSGSRVIDSDPPAEKLKTSPRPIKTLNLCDEPVVQQSGYRNEVYEKSDFYKRYSEHWQHGSCGSSSWEEEAEDTPCYTEEEEDDNDDDEGYDAIGFVEHIRKMSSWSGQPDIKGRNESVRMMLLCAVHFGITFTWGVEMTCERPRPPTFPHPLYIYI